MLPEYILLIFRSVKQIIVVAVGFEVMQPIREPFDQGALSREGRLGCGFLGGKFKGRGGMFETEEECAGVFEVLDCCSVSV